MVRDEYNHSRPVSALIRDWLLYAKAGGGGGILKTVTGNPISISDALAAKIQSLSVSLSPIQAGSGDPSPDNIRPISGRDSVTVTRTGKNLWNGTIVNGFAPIDDLVVGETYTCTAIQTTTSATYLYLRRGVKGVTPTADNTPTIPGGQVIAGQTTRAVTFTVEDGYAYYLWANAQSYKNVEQVQLELGSTPSDYEPYDGTSVTVQLGQTVYGGTAEIISGQGESDYALATFTGAASEAWSFYQTYPNHFQINVSPGNAKNNGTEINAISNAYRGRAGMANNNSNVPYAVFSADGNRIRIKDVDCSSLEEFKAKLQSIPGGLQVCYKLAAPNALTLTPATLSTLRGDNNVWSDGDDVSMTYKAVSS